MSFLIRSVDFVRAVLVSVDIYPLPGTFLGQSFGESYEIVSFGGERKPKSLILFFRLYHFNIFESILPPHSLINTLLLWTWTIPCATTCIDTGPFLLRPPALDPCHRQRQLRAVSSSNASTGHVAAAAAVSANSSTAAPRTPCH